MKTKSLLFAFAGLGLFACSNEDVIDNGGIQGNATVAVKINMPEFNDGSRATGQHTDGNSADVKGTISVTLTAAKVKNPTITLSLPLTAENKNFVFENVENPKSIEVKVNNYDGTPISTLAGANPVDGKWNDLKAPMYGKVEGVVESTASEAEKKNKIIRGVDGNYTSSLTLNHVVGRLEFSGIKHKTHTGTDGDVCIFTDALTLDQISLWKADGDELKESSFTSGKFNTTFPAEGCYAYNVVDGTLPELRLKFGKVQYTSEYSEAHDDITWNESGVGYAAIKEYRLGDGMDAYKDAFGVGDDGKITKFPAGFVYKVTNLTVADENIHEGDPSAEGVTLTATITVTPWTVVSGTAIWK